MPFANKYRFAMGMPCAGDTVGEFVVEACTVEHEEHGNGTISYPMTIVLRGAGGRQTVSRTIRERFARGHTTFSGYGNPYQLQFGRFDVESLGDRRYRVTGCGTGVRIDLERELRRFVAYASACDRQPDESLIADYLESYKRDVTRRHPELAC